MTAKFDEDGNITTFVGDTILFDIHDVPTDLDYTIFFRVYDKNNNTVIPEVEIDAQGNDTVTVEIPPSITDLVNVPSGKKSVTHYYGIKACNFLNDVEHTQTVDGVELEQETKITFMRKRVEGIVPPDDDDTDTDTDTDSDTDTDTDTDGDTDTDTDTDTDNDTIEGGT